MEVSNYPQQADLLKTFAPFTDEKRMSRCCLPEKNLTNDIKQDKFEKKYGMLYTGGAILAGAGILFALHRGGKLFNFTDFIKKHATRISAKALEKLKDGVPISFLEKIKWNVLTKMSNGMKKMQGIGNVNPVKDILWDRFLNTIKLKPLFDKITKTFTKLGKNLAFSKYKAPQRDLLKLQQYLAEAAVKIEKIPPETIKGGDVKILAQKLKNLSELSSKEFNSVVSNFGLRFDDTVNVLNANSEKEFLKTMKNIQGDTMWQKIFGKVKEFGDFIPTKNMEPYKKQIFASLNSSKTKISNSVLDLHKTLSTSVDNIFYDGALNDESLRKSYLQIRDLLNKFVEPKKYNLQRAKVREALLKELQVTANKFKAVENSGNKAEIVEELINLIQNDKKGAIEEAVSLCKILKKHDPYLYRQILGQRNKFQRSFNHAINFETDKSYRKLLDFSLHSLATDLLTQIIGLGTVFYILLDSKKSKGEKISASLETGIPVAGGLLVAFLCNLRQVASGPGALFLAFLSGLVLNRLGKITSNFYLEKNKVSQNDQKNQNNQINQNA